MSTMENCPSRDDLRRFLLGQFGDQETAVVERHLSTCPNCLETLSHLSTDDALLAAMQAQGRTATDPEQDVVQALMDRLAKAAPKVAAPVVTTPWDGQQAVAELPPPPLPDVEGFEILSELGHGAYGVVYKAVQTSLGRTVALKMILERPDRAKDPLERFEKEARAVAALNDPHFVQIYEFGQSGGKPYMALEFVEGGSLDDYCRGLPQPVQFAARTVETLARAMQKAHAAGLVHRDLKPQNVLLAADGTPKIADFGLVKRQTPDDLQLTMQGGAMGTPAYMAPEQTYNARDVGPAADVYALGGVLYCLLTGRPPIVGTYEMDWKHIVRTVEPIAPSRLRPGLPRDLEVICLACLEKEPHKRYASAADLADDLERYREGRPIARRPVTSAERAWRWSKRNPLAATIAALVAAIAVGSSAGLWRLIVLNNSLITATENANIARGKEASERQKAESAQAAKSEQYNQILESFHNVLFKADNRLRDTRQAVDLRKKLLEMTVQDLQQIHDLGERNSLYDRNEAIAYQRLGDIYLVTRKLAQAQEHYDRAYRITKNVAQTDAEDARHLRNLAVLCDKQAKVFEQLGQTLQAREKFQEAYQARLDWDQKLLSQDIDHADAKTAIANSHAQLGRVQLLLGEPHSALDHLTQAKAGYEKAPSADADTNYSLAHQLSQAHYRLGEVDEAERLLNGVVAGYLELYKKNRESDGHVRALSDARVVAGDFQLIARQDIVKAWSLYKLAYAGYKRNYDENQHSASACSGVAKIEYRLGGLLIRAKAANITLKKVPDSDDPLPHFERCRQLREALAKIDPDDMRAHMQWAVALARCGQAEQAAEQARLFLKQEDGNPQLLFQAVCTFALASQTEDTTLRADCRQQAFAVLKKLMHTGWKDHVTLRDDPDLAPIRDDPAFENLLAQGADIP